MTVLQCPVCTWTTEADLGSDLTAPLARALGLSADVVDSTLLADLERDLRGHLGTHTVDDWVAALQAADRYIDQLEAEAAVAAEALRLPPPSMTSLLGEQPSALRDPFHPTTLTAKVIDLPEHAPRPAPAAPRTFEPDQTLIPHIPTGQRAEGQVGRKT